MSGRLPDGFGALEPFVDDWAARGRTDRIRRRVTSTPEQRTAFYAAAKDLVGPALTHLGGRQPDTLAAEDALLLDLLLALTQVSLATEQQRSAEPVHARVQAAFVVDRTSEDFDRAGPVPSGTV